MEIKLSFLGAVREVTGSMHLVEWQGKRILFDCGLNQGHRKTAFEKNRNLPIEPTSIDALVLSHSHIDHTGNIPTIVKQGFKGPIYATPATVDLCDPMLFDSAHIQEQDVRYVNKKRLRLGKKPFEPLYVREDVEQALTLFKAVPYMQPVQLAEGLTATFFDAGHILGSAFTCFDFQENGERLRLLFTGDVGRKNLPILRDPFQVPTADYVVTESTYGDRHHPPVGDMKVALRDLTVEVFKKKGKLIIPSFSVQRTQSIVLLLHELFDAGGIPEIPVFVDSPLSVRATAVFRKHVECYDMETWQTYLSDKRSPFSFASLKYILDVEDSKALNGMPGPQIIISASGMCESGRILHHLAHNIEDPNSTILFVGFQAQHTLGRRIMEGVSPVKIYGDPYEVRAKVAHIEALSAHADVDELVANLKGMNPAPKGVFLVHGEEDQSLALAKRLREEGFENVTVPTAGQTVTLS